MCAFFSPEIVQAGAMNGVNRRRWAVMADDGHAGMSVSCRHWHRLAQRSSLGYMHARWHWHTAALTHRQTHTWLTLKHRAHTHSHTHTHTHTHTHMTRTHAHTHTRARARARTHTHTHAHAHTHTHTHTVTRTHGTHARHAHPLKCPLKCRQDDAKNQVKGSCFLFLLFLPHTLYSRTIRGIVVTHPCALCLLFCLSVVGAGGGGGGGGQGVFLWVWG